MNCSGQVNCLLYYCVDTVSLSLTPISLTSNESTTTILYTSNLFNTSYQIITSITSIEQSLAPGNMLAVNVTIKSLKLTGFTAVFSSPLISSTSLIKLSYITVDLLFRNLYFYTYDNYLGDNFPGLISAMS